MYRIYLTLAFMASTAVAGAHNDVGTVALPLDSIKQLKIMKAHEEISGEWKPTTGIRAPKDTEKVEIPAKPVPAHPTEQPASPAGANQRTTGTFNVPNTEDMPTYPGGEKALREFIRKNRQYPEECKARRLTGKTIVSITIAPDGVPAGMEVTSSSGNAAMDAEAMRVAELMPAWTPAKNINNGKERIYNMTFTFRPGR